MHYKGGKIITRRLGWRRLLSLALYAVALDGYLLLLGLALGIWHFSVIVLGRW